MKSLASDQTQPFPLGGRNENLACDEGLLRDRYRSRSLLPARLGHPGSVPQNQVRSQTGCCCSGKKARQSHVRWTVLNSGRLKINLLPKANNPAPSDAGLFGKLLGLAEGAEALYESQLRSGLKDSRLKPQPPHVYHYNQNSSYIWIALLSRVTAEYRQITKKSTVRFSENDSLQACSVRES